MTPSREEIAVRVLCALAGRDGYGTDTATADAVIYADTLLRNLALTPTPAPVAPPAGKYVPAVGDFVTWGSCTAMWRVLRVDSGGVYAVLAEKRNYTTEPRYLDPSERETLRLATPSELAAAGLAVPPPATTPVPEVLTPDVPEGSTIAQLAAEQRASMGLTASMGSTQHFTHAATPAPEAKRPTHVRVTKIADTGFDVAEGSVYEVVRWYDDGGGAVSPQVMADNGELVELAYVDHSDADYCPSWEPAPCPPPVAGSVGCDKEYAELVRAARLTVERVERLGSVSSVEALRGALKDLDNAISRPVRP